MSSDQTSAPPEAIAIIGMSGRFPGAADLHEFWANLRDGVESIARFTPEELAEAGIDAALVRRPDFVNAGGVLDGAELFDAQFFGFSPREAEILDPQQRVFLELAWQALEDAGYDPERSAGAVGVFGGTAMSSYLFNIIANPAVMRAMGSYQILLGNDKDHLTTHASYKLNLRGPCVTVQTACSTSLVAVCMACQSLLDHQCDMALAGGVAIKFPQAAGYVYQEGMINSPDGHCRPFDAQARGTVGGNGGGVVVLKRLSEALADGDHVRAVIGGAAINNDGSLKVGYTAPSVEGQEEVIAMAQAMAGVDPATITYVEAHGTGTPLGDPIEVAALTRVFRAATDRRGYCALGSVKSNIGHLDPASGVAGLIKTVLMLEHRWLVPTLHFRVPNPQLRLEESPFYVPITSRAWPDGADDSNGAGRAPRRAGVSSFGIGGTNAHVVLEEAPAPAPVARADGPELLVLSARSAAALESATANLQRHLAAHPEADLGDVAYTTQVGRRAFEHRRILVCRDVADAARTLASADASRVLTGVATEQGVPVAFLFSGQGAQYVGMGRDAYHGLPAFREHLDHCATVLLPHVGSDIRDLLLAPPERAGELQERLQQTALTQPVLFAFEYSLARLLMAWGVQPASMIGHSIGEYVAACLAGVFTVDEALPLVAARGRLMQEMPAGAMLAVALPEADVAALLGPEIALASVNGPGQCVLSGAGDAIAALETRLAGAGVPCQRLRTSHAFHSHMMEPMLARFAEHVTGVDLRPPQLPYLSNVTGTWITAAQATDPAYWTTQLRRTVRFGDGLATLLQRPQLALVEVGPGATLSRLAARHPARAAGHLLLQGSRDAGQPRSDVEVLLETTGRLWLTGASIDWAAVHRHERRRRVSLPTYPFQRQRYWVGPRRQGEPAAAGRQPSGNGRRSSPGATETRRDVGRWLHAPEWRRGARAGRATPTPTDAGASWLVLGDGSPLAAALVERLRDRGDDVALVDAGEGWAALGPDRFTIDPARPEHHTALLAELRMAGRLPRHVVHLWSAAADLAAPPRSHEAFDLTQERAFHSLVSLAQAWAKLGVVAPLDVAVLTDGVHAVVGDERLRPEAATLLGLCKVIPQEMPGIRCRCIDLARPSEDAAAERALAEQLVAELTGESADPLVALRDGERWVLAHRRLTLDGARGPGLLRERGVYLITGGLGRIGLLLAEHLAGTQRARLVLVGRSSFPPPPEWSRWVETHGERDPVTQTIRRLQAIERAGSPVAVVAADAADEARLRRAVDEAYTRFGALHGVVHAAGVTSQDAFRYVAELDPSVPRRHFAPKAHGIIALERVLRGRELDFVLLFSSLSAVLGGLGFAAYAAANSFMDAFAAAHDGGDGSAPWISVDWDGWNFQPGYQGDGDATAGMSSQEGLEALRRILVAPAPRRIVVSVGDLESRLRQWVALEHAAADAATADAATADAATADAASADAASADAASELHARPELSSGYVAPRSDVERSIAGIWQSLLGVDRVGVHDNFFELGGHSLLAIQVTSRLRDVLHTDVSVQQLFEAPTIAALAEHLAAGRAQPAEPDAARLADILAMVDGLSDAEVDALLDEQGGA
ncbi:MAG TPA: beta-ketoacyl synthase N-terminal-like domain-containing protein [Gemmatimonadaceae bacterium]|nr:beta-ketoacyl synthase N-terminal-like domain-containing protein [Gemmatimonadaceae bacterium]